MKYISKLTLEVFFHVKLIFQNFENVKQNFLNKNKMCLFENKKKVKIFNKGLLYFLKIHFFHN